MAIEKIKDAMDKAHRCSKCKGRVKLEKIPDTCHCGAPEHYKKTCLTCGFVSYIHRYIIETPKPEIGG